MMVHVYKFIGIALICCAFVTNLFYSLDPVWYCLLFYIVAVLLGQRPPIKDFLSCMERIITTVMKRKDE